MTCIAWDGKTLAADKRATFNGLKRTVTKIQRVGNRLVGFAGGAAQAMEMLAWIRNGCKPEDFPEAQRDKEDWVAVVIISRGGVVEIFERTPYPIRVDDKFYAGGAGRDYALAAMHLGKSAREAVEVACHFDSSCGNGVDELRLKP